MAMTSSVDPLKLIRIALSNSETNSNPFSYCTAAGNVLETPGPECTHIALPSGQASPAQFIFPRSVSTNYRSKRGQGPHYPLDAVCFLLQHRDATYTEYLQEARRIGLIIVSLTDKKELVEYMTNSDLDASVPQHIDTSAELPVALLNFPESAEGRRQQQQQKRTAPKEEEPSTSSAKRAKDSNSAGTASTINNSTTSTLDFTSVALGLKNVFSSTVSSSTTEASSKGQSAASGSLFDQITTANAEGKGPQQSRKGSSQPWIIIVPAGSTSLLTLYNAQDFLDRGSYVSVAQAKGSGQKPVKVLFKHNDIPFEIIDNPARLALSDWSRVIACFCVTSTWQFKGWKWENPVELFQHILGFHLYFDDVAVDPIVAGWNVTKIPLSRNKRHLDTTAVLNFWSRIEESFKNRK